MSFSCDYAVIGAGVNGCWAAYHLARRGHATILLDQSRTIRVSYPETFLRQMMSDAFRQWMDLGKQQGEELFKQTGVLTFGTRDDEFLNAVVSGFESSPSHRGLYQVLDPDQFAERFPYLTPKGELWGCLEQGAGIIKADKALLALRGQFEQAGGQILDGLRVKRIDPEVDSSRVTLYADREKTTVKIVADKGLIVCAGPWSRDVLAQLDLRLPLTTLTVPLCYWRSNNFLPHASFVHGSGQIFANREEEYPGLVKISAHTGIPCDPDRRDACDLSPIIDLIRKAIRQHFPTVEHDSPCVVETCIYTVTPDWNHILDWHPNHRSIVYGAGFSGTGFKLGPVTGELLADMVTGRRTKHDLKPFRAQRFREQSQATSKM